MAEYKRPGVFIEEISLFPPSVASVSTAVPAFLGYTEIDVAEPHRITSLLDFTTVFGAPQKENFIAENKGEKIPSWTLTRKSPTDFLLYYLLKMFFDNGGSVCWVVSVGNFTKTKDSVDFINALDKLEKEDEPTIIVFGDAVTLPWTKYKDVAQKVLNHCGTMKDRFAILDVPNIQKVKSAFSDFRELSSNYLHYGAAYTPFLKTSLSYELTEDYESRVVVQDGWSSYSTSDNGLYIKFSGNGDFPEIDIKGGNTFSCTLTKEDINSDGNVDTDVLNLNGVFGARALDIVLLNKNNISLFEMYAIGSGNALISDINDEELKSIQVYKMVEGSKTPSAILIYSGEDQNIDQNFELLLGQDEYLFSYNKNSNIYTIKLKDSFITVAELAKLFQEKNTTNDFKLHLINNGNALVEKNISSTKLGLVKGLQYPADKEGLMILYPHSNINPDAMQTAKVKSIAPDISFSLNPASANSRLKLEITGVGPGVSPLQVVKQWKEKLATNLNFKSLGFELFSLGDDPVKPLPNGAVSPDNPKLKDLKIVDTEKFNQIKSELDSFYITLPPSGAIAGIYSLVDGTRGVWKAPANVPVMSVIGPNYKISDLEHDDLNKDPGSGKSINAIRNYTGKGTLVMGARTLAGNDNEWRYINVRRLFNMVEESVKKATEAFIFEPNNITTWLKVKGMIESYLYGLWQRGALMGDTPEKAYFVKVGLGKTMTAQDILEGYMKVDIGMAAVRPAEFIILRFSHKMQEA